MRFSEHLFDSTPSLRRRLQIASAGVSLAFMTGLAGAAQMAASGTDLAGASRPADTTVDAGAGTKSGAKADAEAVSDRQLHPRGIPGGQESFSPSQEQLRNAKTIVDTGKEMGLPPRAWVIAVATAIQESTLRNLGDLGAANDHDSQGLFQQRPSSGWGSPKQVTDPVYASSAFYKALKKVNGYEKMPLTQAAQKVQVSAYPDHYAKWEQLAGDIVKGLNGSGPYAKAAASLK